MDSCPRSKKRKKDSCAVDSTIVRKWTDHRPSYSFKINNLSQLGFDKYESPYFSSGGYNWRLAVYPNGEEDTRGYIAMFVELDSTSLTSKPPSEVFAYLTFFIYSKKENKYFTVHVRELSRFNAKTTSGVMNVLPSIFEEEECEFGVDVMVVSHFTDWELISFDKKRTYPKFSWNVKNFSELNEDYYLSNIFSMGGREWTLELYPNGDCVEVEEWLSLYLNLADSETLLADEKIYVRANLRVIDPQGSNHTTKEIHDWFSQSRDGWGRRRFLLLAKLREDYLDMEGSLNVEVEFEVVSATKYSPII